MAMTIEVTRYSPHARLVMTESAATAWKCSCGSLLDYHYHTIWRCRGCGACHEIAPGLTRELPRIQVRFDASLFARNVEELRQALEKLP